MSALLKEVEPLISEEPISEITYVENVCYLTHAFASPESMAHRFWWVVGSRQVEFDSIVGTGLSGALVVPTLARELGKHWAIVRKSNDGSHSMNRIEGTIGTRWLFVDDLIASGNTEQRVKSAVLGATFGDAKYIGTYLYYDGELHLQE